MASELKVFFRGPTAGTSTPSGNTWTANSSSDTTTLLNNIVVANSGAATTYNIQLQNSANTYVNLVSGAAIPANDSLIIDIKQIIEPGKGVKAWGGSANISFHFSGIEISP